MVIIKSRYYLEFNKSSHGTSIFERSKKTNNRGKAVTFSIAHVGG